MSVPTNDVFKQVTDLIAQLAERVRELGADPKVAAIMLTQNENTPDGTAGILTLNLARPPEGVKPTQEHAINANIQMIRGMCAGLVGDEAANEIVGYLYVKMVSASVKQQEVAFDIQPVLPEAQLQ